ncbi:MAG TPA: carbohydrate kinase family protein, partial [Nitrososphaera sp.]|nr:carbohydrate kinase family protein [Nitrososphaera sp.]
GVTTILSEAKNAGAITAADVASDSFSQGRDIVFNNLPLLDYFLPSYVEAKYLTGETNPARMAKFILKKGCKNVIIKTGVDGCYVANDKISQVVPTFTNVIVRDTTGAGDNFVGGFLAGLIDGYDLLEAARYANAVASISVTGMGGISAVQNKQQVLDLMNQ